MAKIQEEVIVIKLSKLVKDNVDVESITTNDVISALTEVTEQLVGVGVVVEVELA